MKLNYRIQEMSSNLWPLITPYYLNFWRNMHHYELGKSNNHIDNHGLMIESGEKS